MPWTLYSPLAGLLSSFLVGFNNHTSLASLGSTGLETLSSASGNLGVHTLALPTLKHQVLCRQVSKHWIHLLSKSWLVLTVSEVGGCSSCLSPGCWLLQAGYTAVPGLMSAHCIVQTRLPQWGGKLPSRKTPRKSFSFGLNWVSSTEAVAVTRG